MPQELDIAGPKVTGVVDFAAAQENTVLIAGVSGESVRIRGLEITSNLGGLVRLHRPDGGATIYAGNLPADGRLYLEINEDGWHDGVAGESLEINCPAQTYGIVAGRYIK